MIRTTEPDQEFLAELREALSEETEKPADEQDYDRIDEITEAIAVITGTDHIIEEIAAAGIERMLSELHRKHKKKAYPPHLPEGGDRLCGCSGRLQCLELLRIRHECVFCSI